MVGFYDPVAGEGSVALAEQGIGAIPSGTGEVQGAAFGSALAGNLTPRLFRASERATAETGLLGVSEYGEPTYAEPEPPVDPAVLNQKYGIKGQLTFDRPMPESSAKDLYDHKHAESVRQDIIDRRDGGILTGAVARTGTGFVAGLLDPLNLVVGMVPVVGEARVASILGRGAIEAMGFGERAAVRGLAGGISGAAGMAALQPLEFGLSRSELDDYTMSDALRNIAFGAALGGGLHVVGGAVADRVTGRYRNPLTQRIEEAGPEARQELLQGAVAQHVAGEPVNVAPALDLADALRAEQDLGAFVRQQQRLTAEADRTIAAAATIENRTVAAAAQTEAVGRRLTELRAQAEATRTELAQLRGGEDTTPARVQAIDTELARPALTMARRGELQAERRMLTEGFSELEAARTEAQAAGVEATLTRQEREASRAAAAMARRQEAPVPQTGFDALARGITAKQNILQAMVERELRRIAGRSGIAMPPQEVADMARNILAASPKTAREAIWPVLGDIASRRAGGALDTPPALDAAAIAAPVINGIRQHQTHAIGELVRPPDNAVSETSRASHEAARPGAPMAGSDELADIERQVADLEARGQPAGEAAALERPPEIVAADAEVEAANARAAAYERAGNCIIRGG